MRKVLLIEDDALLCWLLEKILKNKYDVTVKNDGSGGMGVVGQ
jgi:DNA-binding NtrC family response regulator